MRVALGAFALCWVQVIGGGCQDPDFCVQGFEADTSYRVTIHENYYDRPPASRWDPSQYTFSTEPSALNPQCSNRLLPTSTFDIHTTDASTSQGTRNCQTWNAVFEDVSGADMLGESGLPNSRDWKEPLAAWSQTVDAGGCRAYWQLILLVPSGENPFAAPSASMPPPVVLYRNVSYDSETATCGDAQYCADYTVVSIAEIQ